MNNVSISPQLVELIENGWDETSLLTPVLHTVRKHEGSSLMEVLQSLSTRLNGTSLDNEKYRCSVLSRKCRSVGLEQEAEIFEIASEMYAELAKEQGIQSRIRGQMTPEELKEFILSRDTAIEKVLAFLFGKVGLSKSCIIREVHNLSRLHEGVLEIGKRFTTNVPDTRSIRLKEDDLDLLKHIDPDGDCIDILKDVVLKPGGYGLQSSQILDAYCASWELTPQDLRHICKQHLEELGLDAETRSQQLGITIAA